MTTGGGGGGQMTTIFQMVRKFQNYRGQINGQNWSSLTIDHGVDSRVPWLWSVPYNLPPPPPPNQQYKINMEGKIPAKVSEKS